MLLQESVVRQLPLFKSTREKERFIMVVGALTTRIISLSKAGELLGMDRGQLLKLLEAAGFSFSYLDPQDVSAERSWA